MVKFAHLLVLSALIVWLAGSGCVGDSTSEVKESKANPDVAEIQNGEPAEYLEIEPTQAEIQNLDSEIKDLEDLLANASPEEEIVIEEL
jgi:TolA-binding protein